MKNNRTLTRKQGRLLKEIQGLAELFGFDYSNITEYKPDARSTMLEVMKNKIVRGQVVIWYTLVNEYLDCVISRFFFGRRRTFPELWKTKSFRLFNHFVLEGLYMRKKLDLVRSIRSIPNQIIKSIESLNALRNALAHAIFPENLRKPHLTWSGRSIFSLDGAQLFMEDMGRVTKFFWRYTC